MRILLTSYFALPNPGGLWTYVRELQQGLVRAGHEAELIVHVPGLEAYYHPNTHRAFDKRTVIEAVRQKVLRYFIEHRLPMHEELMDIEVERYSLEMAYASFGLDEYDVIHTQDILSTRAAARIKSANTPLVATIHGNLTAESMCRGDLREDDSVLHEFLAKHERIGLTSSDVAILPSQWLKNVYMRDYHVPDGHMQVIANGMDVASFLNRMNGPLRADRPAGKKIIACNARLDQVKGHVHLFRALAKLKSERRDWICWLIGDGELRRELRQLCKQLGLEEHVLFLGRRDDVPALLHAADLCVLPSLQENCPFAVMEAQVVGRTMIASEVGGIPEMIRHEKTGLLTSPGDHDELYRALKRALLDDRFREEVGKRAQAWARTKWAIARMQDQTFRLYEQVLQQKRSP